MAGNPNVGKSVLFMNLTGKFAEVSNYPGTTVEVSRGFWQGAPVSDSPGIYGLTGSNEEEKMAMAMAANAAVIVNVVDGTRLRRDLFLTLQLVGLGVPMVVVVNMMDEVNRQGLVMDLGGLSKFLGVPVVPVTAVSGEGMVELTGTLKRLVQAPRRCSRRTEDSAGIRRRANEIYARFTVPGQPPQSSFLERLLTGPVTGFIIAALILAATWWLLGGVVAKKIVDFSEGVVMKKWLLPPLMSLCRLAAPSGLLAALLNGEYGLLTMGLSYGIGLLLPLVFSFYLLLSVLEDSGYLPRLAVLLDNTFSPLGLNGRAVIPTILGFGCVTMAVVSTRSLTSRREKVILTFLLGIAVPCSAQTGVIATMLVPMGLRWLVFYGGILLGVFLLAGIVLNKIVPGQSQGLFFELPPLRLPRPLNILKKSWARSRVFIKEALPLFAVGACLLTVFAYWGWLAGLEKTLGPLVGGWLKLPAAVVGAFIMGIIRRDFGAAALLTMNLLPRQRFVALVTMTLFVPCIATVLVTIKERGLVMGLAIWFISVATALMLGGVLAHII